LKAGSFRHSKLTDELKLTLEELKTEAQELKTSLPDPDKSLSKKEELKHEQKTE
jgi:hypothetical protein